MSRPRPSYRRTATSTVAPRRSRQAKEIRASCSSAIFWRQSQITSRALRLASDASRAEGAGVGADLLERAGQRLDVGVGEVAGEVLLDCVPVVAARFFHRGAALVGEDDE